MRYDHVLRREKTDLNLISEKNNSREVDLIERVMSLVDKAHYFAEDALLAVTLCYSLES